MSTERITTTSGEQFWTVIHRMYKTRDDIREASNKMVDLSTQLQTFITPSNDLLAYSNPDSIDMTEIRKVLSGIKKKINSILSYANELSPHLDNSAALPALSNMAKLLISQMNWPSNMMVYLKLKDIILGCDYFTQTANILRLNPTKKSLKAAFVFDVGIQNARLKTILETYHSNY